MIQEIYGWLSSCSKYSPKQFEDNGITLKSTYAAESLTFSKLHCCFECGKSFTTSSGLKQHQHIHSSVKPFKCEVCFKAYTQFSNLCRHKRMHVNCRQHLKCMECGQYFTSTTTFNKHKKFCEKLVINGGNNRNSVINNKYEPFICLNDIIPKLANFISMSPGDQQNSLAAFNPLLQKVKHPIVKKSFNVRSLMSDICTESSLIRIQSINQVHQEIESKRGIKLKHSIDQILRDKYFSDLTCQYTDVNNSFGNLMHKIKLFSKETSNVSNKEVTNSIFVRSTLDHNDVVKYTDHQPLDLSSKNNDLFYGNQCSKTLFSSSALKIQNILDNFSDDDESRKKHGRNLSSVSYNNNETRQSRSLFSDKITCETSFLNIFRSNFTSNDKSGQFASRFKKEYRSDYASVNSNENLKFYSPENLNESTKVNCHYSNRAKDKYSCKYCGKNFPRSANLTRHLRTHTGEQPYKCKFCERSFSISSNLQRHVRNIHNKEKPFRCLQCERCFGQQTNLERHIKKHKLGTSIFNSNNLNMTFKE